MPQCENCGLIMFLGEAIVTSYLSQLVLLACQRVRNGQHDVATADCSLFIIIIIIFINCNWVVTRWQYTFTHKNNIEQHN